MVYKASASISTRLHECLQELEHLKPTLKFEKTQEDSTMIQLFPIAVLLSMGNMTAARGRNCKKEALSSSQLSLFY
jgi:hypothetical protein